MEVCRPDLEPLRFLLVGVTVGEALFEVRMAAELKRRGHSVFVVCRAPVPELLRGFRLGGFPLSPAEVCGLSGFRHGASGVELLPWSAVEEAFDTPPVADLLAAGLALEQAYGIPNWQAETVSEHLYEGRDTLVSARHLHGLFARWERLLGLWPPDLVFTGDGGDNIRTSLLHCLRRRGIEVFYQGWTPVPGCIYFGNSNHYLLNVRPVDDERPPTAEELQFARQYINGLRDQSLDLLAKRPVGSVVPSSRQLSRLLQGHYTPQEALQSWLATVRKSTRKRRQLRRQRPQYVWPGEEPFAFFPLHMAGEAQLSVRAPMYTTQAVPVEMAAHALPAGMLLYVKEHPAFVGEYAPEFIDLITSLPNVRLVDPTCPSHLLITKSKLVCVINSTAGLEGVVLGRPVLCLWRNLYSHWGLTHDCSDPARLAAAVREALASESVPDEQVVQLLCRLRRHAYPGVLFIWDDSEENLLNNTRSLLQAVADRRADRNR
jgi:hypothetical protein